MLLIYFCPVQSIYVMYWTIYSSRWLQEIMNCIVSAMANSMDCCMRLRKSRQRTASIPSLSRNGQFKQKYKLIWSLGIN